MVCAALALALIAVILIPASQAALETQVQRAFFPQHYDYRRKLRELAAALVHILDREELVKRLGDALTGVLDVESCDIFLAEEQTAQLALAYPTAQAGQPMAEGLVHVLERRRQRCARERLALAPAAPLGGGARARQPALLARDAGGGHRARDPQPPGRGEDLPRPAAPAAGRSRVPHPVPRAQPGRAAPRGRPDYRPARAGQVEDTGAARGRPRADPRAGRAPDGVDGAQAPDRGRGDLRPARARGVGGPRSAEADHREPGPQRDPDERARRAHLVRGA